MCTYGQVGSELEDCLISKVPCDLVCGFAGHGGERGGGGGGGGVGVTEGGVRTADDGF